MFRDMETQTCWFYYKIKLKLGAASSLEMLLEVIFEKRPDPPISDLSRPSAWYNKPTVFQVHQGHPDRYLTKVNRRLLLTRPGDVQCVTECVFDAHSHPVTSISSQPSAEGWRVSVSDFSVLLMRTQSVRLSCRAERPLYRLLVALFPSLQESQPIDRC